MSALSLASRRLLNTRFTLLLSAPRVPSIKFPPRRSPDGQSNWYLTSNYQQYLELVLSLLSLSLDNITPSALAKTDATTNKAQYYELPSNYGRAPLSNTEIDIINVRPQIISTAGNVLFHLSYRAVEQYSTHSLQLKTFLSPILFYLI